MASPGRSEPIELLEALPRPRVLPFVLKQIVRRPTASALTVLGVAVAMFLFGTVLSLQAGVREATAASAKETVLVVYRKDRFCPFTSRLPEDYEARIRRIDGVADVTPMRVVVSNCRASLDVVTFRGVRRDRFAAGEGRRLSVASGSIDAWLARSDAALLGRALAERRGLKVGDRFDANGVTVTVAAVFDSEEPQHQNVAYVDLDFLQLSPAIREDGVVTQFNVRVDDPKRLEEVARAIDDELRAAQEPTHTSSEKAFVARAAADVVELIGFTRWVGLACLAAVLALVANAMVLSVQGRVRDIGILQTLGFTGAQVAGLVVLEGLVLALAGGTLGVCGAAGALSLGHLSLSNEGLSIHFVAGAEVVAPGLLATAALGLVAGIAPALQAARIPIAASFRAV